MAYSQERGAKAKRRLASAEAARLPVSLEEEEAEVVMVVVVSGGGGGGGRRRKKEGEREGGREEREKGGKQEARGAGEKEREKRSIARVSLLSPPPQHRQTPTHQRHRSSQTTRIKGDTETAQTAG
eukprot:2337412-Rhodomonas_salina.4